MSTPVPKKYYKSLSSIYDKLISMRNDMDNKLDILEEKWNNKSDKWKDTDAGLKLNDKISDLYFTKGQLSEAISSFYFLID